MIIPTKIRRFADDHWGFILTNIAFLNHFNQIIAYKVGFVRRDIKR